MRSSSRRHLRGALLIEVLVTLLILAFGMLGYAGLQARSAVTNLEGYQRVQALALVQDLADRINLNRANAASYVGNDVGVNDPGTCATTPGATRDLCEWAQLLRGSAEKKGSQSVGSIIGARGCVEDLGSGQYLVSVAWQGLLPSGPPPVACGVDQYSNENMRRAVSVVVRIGVLS